MDRIVINDVIDILCSMSGSKRNRSTDFIWETGLKNREDEEIKLALKYYCEFREKPYMPTPAEFMSYLKYDDPHGHKAAQKRIEETRELLYGDNNE